MIQEGVMRMSINEIIMYIMVIFMIIGAVDHVIGGKLGLGEQFEEGIMAMGSLGIINGWDHHLSPHFGKFIEPNCRSFIQYAWC